MLVIVAALVDINNLLFFIDMTRYKNKRAKQKLKTGSSPMCQLPVGMRSNANISGVICR